MARRAGGPEPDPCAAPRRALAPRAYPPGTCASHARTGPESPQARLCWATDDHGRLPWGPVAPAFDGWARESTSGVRRRGDPLPAAEAAAGTGTRRFTVAEGDNTVHDHVPDAD
jgi:hypothetical protein